ncbi:unnamed protein product, partial [Polarella glacialis]
LPASSPYLPFNSPGMTIPGLNNVGATPSLPGFPPQAGGGVPGMPGALGTLPGGLSPGALPGGLGSLGSLGSFGNLGSLASLGSTFPGIPAGSTFPGIPGLGLPGGPSAAAANSATVASAIAAAAAANKLQETIDIPQSTVGLLIGKQATTINAIKAFSRAHCFVEQHTPTEDKARVTMIGSASEIEMCKKAVNGIIDGSMGPTLLLQLASTAPPAPAPGLGGACATFPGHPTLQGPPGFPGQTPATAAAAATAAHAAAATAAGQTLGMPGLGSHPSSPGGLPPGAPGSVPSLASWGMGGAPMDTNALAHAAAIQGTDQNEYYARWWSQYGNMAAKGGERRFEETRGAGDAAKNAEEEETNQALQISATQRAAKSKCLLDWAGHGAGLPEREQLRVGCRRLGQLWLGREDAPGELPSGTGCGEVLPADAEECADSDTSGCSWQVGSWPVDCPTGSAADCPGSAPVASAACSDSACTAVAAENASFELRLVVSSGELVSVVSGVRQAVAASLGISPERVTATAVTSSSGGRRLLEAGQTEVRVLVEIAGPSQGLLQFLKSESSRSDLAAGLRTELQTLGISASVQVSSKTPAAVVQTTAEPLGSSRNSFPGGSSSSSSEANASLAAATLATASLAAADGKETSPSVSSAAIGIICAFVAVIAMVCGGLALRARYKRLRKVGVDADDAKSGASVAEAPLLSQMGSFWSQLLGLQPPEAALPHRSQLASKSREKTRDQDMQDARKATATQSRDQDMQDAPKLELEPVYMLGSGTRLDCSPKREQRTPSTRIAQTPTRSPEPPWPTSPPSAAEAASAAAAAAAAAAASAAVAAAAAASVARLACKSDVGSDRPSSGSTRPSSGQSAPSNGPQAPEPVPVMSALPAPRTPLRQLASARDSPLAAISGQAGQLCATGGSSPSSSPAVRRRLEEQGEVGGAQGSVRELPRAPVVERPAASQPPSEGGQSGASRPRVRATAVARVRAIPVAHPVDLPLATPLAPPAPPPGGGSPVRRGTSVEGRSVKGPAPATPPHTDGSSSSAAPAARAVVRAVARRAPSVPAIPSSLPGDAPQSGAAATVVSVRRAPPRRAPPSVSPERQRAT